MIFQVVHFMVVPSRKAQKCKEMLTQEILSLVSAPFRVTRRAMPPAKRAQLFPDLLAAGEDGVLQKQRHPEPQQ